MLAVGHHRPETETRVEDRGHGQKKAPCWGGRTYVWRPVVRRAVAAAPAPAGNVPAGQGEQSAVNRTRAAEQRVERGRGEVHALVRTRRRCAGVYAYAVSVHVPCGDGPKAPTSHTGHACAVPHKITAAPLLLLPLTHRRCMSALAEGVDGADAVVLPPPPRPPPPCAGVGGTTQRGVVLGMYRGGLEDAVEVLDAVTVPVVRMRLTVLVRQCGKDSKLRCGLGGLVDDKCSKSNPEAVCARVADALHVEA
ncbi:hypothetical protein CYMTET_40055 [Cymbomonas tetramitiformis]|uniref:Uncharacterized protein n=1 Tax=Cymbomonas tetramitiformis TaxID=36881 RepID=A0AAE0C8V5_9CHLO|nr:hypothetical protein CYMTET_40055 [Cymbomonas tetramitiformis]